MSHHVRDSGLKDAFVARARARAEKPGENLLAELEADGFTRVAVPAEEGGAGGDFIDLATIVRAAAFFALPVPLLEANLDALAKLPPPPPDALALALKAVRMTGAMDRALSLTVEHTKTRVQFGKPLAQFQAIQQELARLAGAVAMATAVADQVVELLALGEDPGELVNAAWVCAVDSARITIEVSHQLHGAIGLTIEHALHHSTESLIAWRDDGPSDRRLCRALGTKLATLDEGQVKDLFVHGDAVLGTDS